MQPDESDESKGPGPGVIPALALNAEWPCQEDLKGEPYLTAATMSLPISVYPFVWA